MNLFLIILTVLTYLFCPILPFSIEKTSIPVSQTIVFYASSPCHIYELSTNYQILNLEIKNPFNSTIKSLMISDQPNLSLDKCEENELINCPSNASLCIMKQPEIEFNHAMGVCTDKIYLHVFANGDSSSFPNETPQKIGILTTKFNLARQCAISVKENTILALKCATLSQEQCYSDDECNDECQWVSCTYNSLSKKDNFKEFTLCLPANIYAEDKICLDHFDFFSSPNKRFSFKKCGYPLNSHKMPGTEGVTVGIVGIILLLILIFGFIVSIFYYRWSLSKKKIIPFTPPNFCPEWVYPRYEVEKRKFKPMLQRNSYQPPIAGEDE